MPKLIRQHDVPLSAEARHVVFAGENALAFATPTADVWKVAAEPTPSRPELLLPGPLVLSPVAHALGQTALDPAGGGYPRLAVSLPAHAVVVNTHDLVLVAGRLSGDEAPRLIHYGWGQYYPRLEFSPDHSRFAAHADTLLVFDTRTWKGHQLDGIDACGWHPSQPVQLCVRLTGELFWADWRKGMTPAIRELGTIGLRDGFNQAAGLVVLEGAERFVVAFHPPRLELWGLNPLEMIESQDVDGGEIFGLRLSPDGRWLAALAEDGVRVWDTETPLEVGNPFSGIADLDFSPSGRRFVTHRSRAAGADSDPGDLGIDREPGADSAVCWEIAE